MAASIPIAPLLVLSLVIGVLPRWLLEVVEPAADAVVAPARPSCTADASARC